MADSESSGLNVASVGSSPGRAVVGSVQWSRARPEDAASMAAVYNHWVDHGGRVPGVQRTTEHRVQVMVADLQGRGYPVWCFWAGDVLVGWCSMGPFPWGGGGTLGTADLSVYVLPQWVGSGVGAQAVFLAYRHRHVLGFRALVVWVLRGNRLSRNLALGTGMQHWGRLPKLVDAGGGLYHDVDVWGCHLDDEAWCARMDRLVRKLERRVGGWIRERRRVAVAQ